MDQNLQSIAKRIWNMVRVAYFMMRKGISKSKLLLDLNIMMKRGKIAGKAIGNLMFHHHHHHYPVPTEYEFSCSNSPSFPVGKRRHLPHYNNSFFTCAHEPAMVEDDAVSENTVRAALETLSSGDFMVEASPALPGFGRSPKVRQLRITDSPFPLQDLDEDRHIDKAAEEFISRFYKELRLQKTQRRTD